MLRSALIGAVVGAGVLGTFAIAAGGDCGNCAGDHIKAILSGAMYGALIGAAIRLHPSRRPTPGLPSRTTTFSPHVTRHVKAMNVVVRF
jgi:outer membrane lipoprotein SlyB